MTPERLRRLLLDLRRLDAAMGLPAVRELVDHVEDQHALLRDLAREPLPPELRQRLRRLAPDL